MGADPPHVVAAIRQAQNLPPARLAGGRHASVVDVDDLAARLVVQSSRQSGLSVVCTDLLDFGGDEIYLRPEPALTGMPFGVALFAYETATLIGLRRAGGVMLNPPHGHLHRGRRRADPDRRGRLADPAGAGTPRAAEAGRSPGRSAEPVRPERVLVIGWNARGVKIVKELDNYVAPGSRAAGGGRPPGREQRSRPGGRAGQPARYRQGLRAHRPVLAGDARHRRVYEHVIVLADDRVEPASRPTRRRS